MIGRLKTLISDIVGYPGPDTRDKDHDGRLATAVLLIRVATGHGEMSLARRSALHTILKSGFELDDCAAAQLIVEAAAIERVAIDLYHFTRQLNNFLNDDGRQRTVRMMWKIAYADGTANEFDQNIIWRAADLLGVSSRQRVELRQQVAIGARLAANS